nr:hypothetical protein [uncultured Nitrososphaera sp.]
MTFTPSDAKIQEKKERIESEIKAFISLFETGKLPELIETVYLKTAGKPSDAWSLNNKLIMLIIGQTLDARSYNAWKAAGRNVKAGARAFYILKPVTRLVEKKDKNGNPVIGENGKPVTFPVLVGFQGTPEFRYEDTEGKPLEEYKPRELPKLHEVAAKWGVKIRYANTWRGEEGSTNGTDSIKICVAENQDFVFWHELGHVAHGKVLAKKGKKLQPGQDVTQEYVAELVSVTLARLYGQTQYQGTAFRYLKAYSQDKKTETIAKLCMKVISEVQECLTLILETAEQIPEDESVITMEVAA